MQSIVSVNASTIRPREPFADAEPREHGRTEQAAAGGRADQREARQGQADAAGTEIWVKFQNFRRATAEKIPV